MNNIEKIRRKARASWWEDGLTETIAGLGILFIGIYGFVMNALEGEAYSIAEKGLFIVILGSIFLVRYLIKKAKERWVWPFTGYSIPSRSRGLWMIGGVVLSLAMMVLIFLTYDNPPVYEILLSIFVAIILSNIAIYSGLRRFWIYAFVALITGIVSIFMRLDAEIFPFLLLTVTGTAMAVVGATLYNRFRREVAHGHLSEDN